MTPLEHALYYASRGWRVIPITPGSKYPKGIDNWQIKATTDQTRIRRYWGKHPDHGVGIVTGIESGLVVIDIDTYKPGASEAWDDLVAAHGGDFPDTVEAVTGNNGRHLYAAHPTDGGPPITNADHALPYGIDVRGEGGFVVAAPTIHPVTGIPYAWEVEHDPFDGLAPVPLPTWFVELLRTPAPEQIARDERVPYEGSDSIVERFAADHTWPELLTPAGWQFHSARVDAAGRYELWTRPGKEVRDGASASLYYRGSDVLKVFTSSAEPLRSMETYTRFGFYAAMHHGGDHSAAAREYRRLINRQHDTEEREQPKSPDGPPPPRPSIVHNGRQLDDIVRDAVDALIGANSPPLLFVRAGQLARLRDDEEQRPIIEGLRPEHVRLLLADAANWYRATKDGVHISTSPPLDVSSTVLAAGYWPLPPLAGVVELPVLRHDGTFHATHGYDRSTKLYHWHRGEPYAEIPENPTIDELMAAVALIDEMMCDFPWDTTADRANAWALLLTPLIRAIVGQVPMALIDAPEPGTGKGLLVKVSSIVTTGRSAALMAWPTDDTELEKKITATLMAGNTVVVFDNVEGMIKSPTLAAVLTADSWHGRTLGRSEMVMVPNRATWAATGNNIDVGGDLARRCYRIRLDAHQAQPWLRTGFRHTDLEGWALDNRGRLLHALCTIVRSWWVAGRPKAAQLPAMGGYSAWVQTVGGILEHAGVGDFLANLAEFHASADRDASAWEAFLTAWHEEFTGQSLTVAELTSKMKDPYIGHLLRDVLPDDLSGYFDTPGFSKRFGLALRKQSGRHFGKQGLHLVEMPRDRRAVAVYAVMERATEGAGVNPTPARSDSVTRDDTNERGSAGVVLAPTRERNGGEGQKNAGSGDPNNSRDSRTPALDVHDPDLF